MSSASFFSPVLSSGVHVSHTQDSSLDRTKKKKRKKHDAESGFGGEVSGTRNTFDQRKPSASLSSSAVTALTASPEEMIQDQDTALTLGQKDSLSVPHDDLEAKQWALRRNIDHEIATLRPPFPTIRYPGSGVFIANNGNSKVGLRQRHLAAVTAIMHRCMLAGDYIRAGRAWGMILRAEINGHSMDLRANGRWGLGAEILLQRDTQLVRKNFEVKAEVGAWEERTQLPGSLLGTQSFERAKDYYERLILQHPYRKTFAQATSSVDFYLAMFGLWIFSVANQEAQSERELALSDGAADQTNRNASDEIREVSISASKDRNRVVREEVHKEVLQGAETIAGQLDELTSSPPYSDDAKFAGLSNMIKLWKVDLSRMASIAQTDMRHDIEIND